MSQGPTNDFEFEVARGARRGMTPLTLCGTNADVDAAEDIFDVGGDVPAFDAGGYSIEVLSADADDTAAGTGARTLLIKGVTIAGVYQEKTVSMNGATPVAVTGTWGFVNSAEVATAGTSLGNEGVITIRKASAGATLCQIAAGHSISDGAFYYVPSGYRFIVDCVRFWTVTAGTITFGVGRIRGGIYQFQAHGSITNAGLGMEIDLDQQYVGGDVIKARVTAVSATNQSVGAVIHGILLDADAV